MIAYVDFEKDADDYKGIKITSFDRYKVYGRQTFNRRFSPNVPHPKVHRILQDIGYARVNPLLIAVQK